MESDDLGLLYVFIHLITYLTMFICIIYSIKPLVQTGISNTDATSCHGNNERSNTNTSRALRTLALVLLGVPHLDIHYAHYLIWALNTLP